MSPPFVACQPHCLGHLQHLPWLPHGGPALPLTLEYRTGTARTSSGTTLTTQRWKQLVALAVACTVIDPWFLYGFALPQTPELTEINQARIEHGGFLRDTFQVFRAGCRPDSSRESIKIGPPAGRRPENPAEIRPGNPISGPEALLRNIG